MPDLGALAHEDFCYLTTVGRVTGNPHEIEIWFALTPATRTLYMLSGNPRSDWVENLRKTPKVTLRIAGAVLDGRARVVGTAEEEDELARDLLVEKYERTPGSLSNWRRISLPVAVDLA